MPTLIRAVRLSLAVVASAATSVTGQRAPAADRAALVDRLADELLEIARLPGLSISILQDGEVVFARGYGLADVDTKTPVDTSTKFRAASVSKMITVTALARLYQAGKVDLDAPVQRYVPSWTGDTGITARLLAGHLAGIGHYQPQDRFDPTHHYASVTEALGTFMGSPRVGPPGAQYAYSTHGYTLLSAVIEAGAGTSFLASLGTEVFEPLGMTHTSYGDSPNPALSEGDVVSTLDDYGRFAQMIVDGGVWRGRRVLSEEAIRQMRHNWSAGVPIVYSPRGDIPYGLGAWLDAVDTEGDGTVISSPGIGGFVPLIDYDRRMVFVFVTLDEAGRIWPAMLAILDAARALIDQGTPAGPS